MFATFASATTLPADDRSDQELVTLAVSGDREAGGLLVGRYERRVRLFLLKLCGDASLADDLAQDTFIRMLKYLHRYDPQYAMQTWLLTIARRLWINHITRTKPTVSDVALHGTHSGEETPIARLMEEDELERQRKKLNTGLAALSESQRQAVVLFHQQELSIQEVSEVMEMPIGTVKSHLHRARANLRNLLTEKEPTREA